MKLLKSAVAIAAGTLFAGAAFAQPGFSIEQRDRAAQEQIGSGVQSGQLTHREAARLEAERMRIEHLESVARADGVLTRYERARIREAQDHLSRNIYREAHDEQVADARSTGRHPGWRYR